MSQQKKKFIEKEVEKLFKEQRTFEEMEIYYKKRNKIIEKRDGDIEKQGFWLFDRGSKNMPEVFKALKNSKVLNQNNKLKYNPSPEAKKSISAMLQNLQTLENKMETAIKKQYKGAPKLQLDRGKMTEFMRFAIMGKAFHFDPFDILPDYAGGDVFFLDAEDSSVEIQYKIEGGRFRLNYSLEWAKRFIQLNGLFLKGQKDQAYNILNILNFRQKSQAKEIKELERGKVDETNDGNKVKYAIMWKNLSAANWVFLSFRNLDRFEVAIPKEDFPKFVKHHPNLFKLVSPQSSPKTNERDFLDLQFVGASSSSEFWKIGISKFQSIILHDIPAVFYNRRGTVSRYYKGMTQPANPDSGYSVKDITRYNDFIKKDESTFEFLYDKHYGGFGKDGKYK